MMKLNIHTITTNLSSIIFLLVVNDVQSNDGENSDGTTSDEVIDLNNGMFLLFKHFI